MRSEDGEIARADNSNLFKTKDFEDEEQEDP